jgi:hypothetical protein
VKRYNCNKIREVEEKGEEEGGEEGEKKLEEGNYGGSM